MLPNLVMASPARKKTTLENAVRPTSRQGLGVVDQEVGNALLDGEKQAARVAGEAGLILEEADRPAAFRAGQQGRELFIEGHAPLNSVFPAGSPTGPTEEAGPRSFHRGGGRALRFYQ